MRYLVILISIMASLFAGGCCGADRLQDEELAALEERLAEGDLLFRRGTGFAGRMVTSLDAEGRFSHVGVVVRTDEGWQVVHAVPYEPEFEGDIDRVKREPLAAFLGRYAEARFGHFRATLTPEQIAIIAANALRLSRERVPFDHDYDLSDSSHLYCTELVEHLFLMVGCSLSEGRRTEVHFPSLSGCYLFPSDLTRSSLLKPIY